MSRIPYRKPHASPEEVVKQLQERGLQVADFNAATKAVEMMGYTRLRIYLESRCDTRSEGRPFKKGVSFEDILRICECDAKLRAACLGPVGDFEILFRNSISEALSRQSGSHPQYDVAVFKGKGVQDNVLKTFTRIYESQVKRDGLAKEYSQNYSRPELPPIWYMKEMLTFGDVVDLYRSLDTKIGTSIAKDFGGLDQHFFNNWVSALVDLRNVCAHHDRLFNRTFQKNLKVLRLNKRKVPSSEIRTDKLAGLLQCLNYAMSKRCGISMTIEADIGKILTEYPEINLEEVGYQH